MHTFFWGHLEKSTDRLWRQTAGGPDLWSKCGPGAAQRLRALWGGQPAPQLPMPAHVKTPSLLSNTVPTTLWGPHFCCYCHPFQVSIPASLPSLEAFRALRCWAPPCQQHWSPVGQHHPRSQSGSSPPAGLDPADRRRGAKGLLSLHPNWQDSLAFKGWLLPSLWVHRRTWCPTWVPRLLLAVFPLPSQHSPRFPESLLRATGRVQHHPDIRDSSKLSQKVYLI